jgi:enoyl-CoA hydratase/carnithine racemase
MPDLVVQRADGVLRLTIDRPEQRNALSDELATAICAELEDVAGDRVVLLASTGDRVFCAGADLSVMSDVGAHQGRGGVRRVAEAMRACPVPVVVRVQGLCLAGGVGVILGADIVVAAQSAGFGLPEIDRGLWPFMVSVLLAQHVSPKVAMDLMMTGRRVGAAEAAAIGLVSRVVPNEDLDVEVETVLTSLAAAAPLAVRQGKRTFWQLLDAGTTAALTAMQEELTLLTQTEDAAEGIAAFYERRPPQWQGR